MQKALITACLKAGFVLQTAYVVSKNIRLLMLMSDWTGEDELFLLRLMRDRLDAFVPRDLE